MQSGNYYKVTSVLNKAQNKANITCNVLLTPPVLKLPLPPVLPLFKIPPTEDEKHENVNLMYNRENNIMKECTIFVYVWFTISKVGLGFHDNKLCTRVASQVYERLKT